MIIILVISEFISMLPIFYSLLECAFIMKKKKKKKTDNEL